MLFPLQRRVSVLWQWWNIEMKSISFLICYSIFVIAVLTVIPGCMVGPDYDRPKTAAETSSGYYQAGRNVQDVNMLSRNNTWWLRFGDRLTAELVRKALENNYDLKAAAARVLQSQAILEQERGKLLPDISYNFNRDRSKFSFDFGTGRSSALTTTYGQNISISYVLDLFGKLRHAEQAAWRDLLATKANEIALTNSIMASVIQSRVNIATLQKQLSIAKANTASRQQTLEIVERRYRKGLVSPVDVRLARENLAASRSSEPALELSIVQAQYSLDILLGQRPGQTDELPKTLPDLPDLEPVPVGLPASLLDRRPDLISAEQALKAANQRIGVSIAQLFPDLTLTGTYGFSANEWRNIWIDETEIYSALFRVTQPLFKGGQLRAQVDISKAVYQELASNYANAVLSALREVEDALISEQKLQQQLEEVQFRFEEAKAAEDLSRDRYQQGVSNLLLVLESERRRRLAETELAIIKGRLWTNRVNLFLALGGDWQTETLLADNQGK